MGTEEHKAAAAKSVAAAIITLSSTRSLAEDASGGWMRDQLEGMGHEVVHHEVIPDNPDAIAAALMTVIQGQRPQVVLMNGGTGISPRDVTIETVKGLLEKEMTGFGALFSTLSYEEIGSPAILSRATAGVIKGTAVFCMPGSLKACKLACEKLIFPELGHVAKHLAEA
jgi:molybdenum cofactor biosynthesis protein B